MTRPPGDHLRATPLAFIAILLSCFGLAAAAPAAAQGPAPEAARDASRFPAREERGNLVLEGVPAPDEALNARLEGWLETRRATFLDWLPDGGLLIGTRFGDTQQLHRVAAPLGAREQLTFYREPVSTARASPDASAGVFAFLQDSGGNENAQVYLYRIADRSVRLLTDGKSRNGALTWSRDGKRLAFASNARDGTNIDVYVADVTDGSQPRLMIAGTGENAPLDWSPDGTKVLVRRYVSANESYLFVGDVATGSMTPLDTSGRKIAIGDAKFAPDGRGIYLLSDENGEFSELLYLDPVTGTRRSLTSQVRWDIEDFDVSADGRYVAFVANEDGTSRLTVLDQQRQSELVAPGMPAGIIHGLRFDTAGKRLAFSVQSSQSPEDTWVFELERSEVVRWTRSETGRIDPAKLVPARLVRYPTWDRTGGRQRTISAYMYEPAAPGPHPVVIDIHGGPESQSRPGFDPFTQFLVSELGYVVIAPNVRGSSGYGKSFLKLDDGTLREDSVRDIGALLVWIGLQKSLDAKRVVVMGGSYGGFMALATLAAYSDRLRGGIDIVGISNFVTFLQNTSAYRRDLRRAEYGDERDPKMRDFLNRISPLTRAPAIRKPLLVVQGLNDPRVPASESEQIVRRVRLSSGEVWYLAAKDEGHGFRKKANADFLRQTVAQFLERMKQ